MGLLVVYRVLQAAQQSIQEKEKQVEKQLPSSLHVCKIKYMALCDSPWCEARTDVCSYIYENELRAKRQNHSIFSSLHTLYMQIIMLICR